MVPSIITDNGHFAVVICDSDQNRGATVRRDNDGNVVLGSTENKHEAILTELQFDLVLEEGLFGRFTYEDSDGVVVVGCGNGSARLTRAEFTSLPRSDPDDSNKRAAGLEALARYDEAVAKLKAGNPGATAEPVKT